MKPEDVARTEPNDFTDHFSDDCAPGTVVGQTSADGIVRKGNDVENVISIDNGALRIQPLVEPGWGRSGVAYGPYRRANGLTFAACVLNGHNTSQVGNLTHSLVRRLGRWVKGSETDNVTSRMLHWLVNGDKRLMVRQVQRWAWLNRQSSNGADELDENMALGWFGRAVPTDPLQEGNALVMHAAGPENGELWVNAGDKPLRVLRGVQNVPVYYIVVLREQGAAYYAASLTGARGFAAYPQMRPLAIDAFHDEEVVYAGLYQSVLGQIGFRVDTRVYAAQVAQMPALNKWYGTAHAADRLSGDGLLDDAPAEVGGAWTVYSGMFERTPQGTRPCDLENLAVLDPGFPSGLVHVLIECETKETSASIVWRFQDEDNYWFLYLNHRTCWLMLMLEGACYDLAAASGAFLLPGKPNAVQILDDGETMGLYLNGRLLFDTAIVDKRLAAASGAGLLMRELPYGGLRFSHFEAHPRTVAFPEGLALPALWQEQGDVVAVRDDFVGPAGPLAGRETPSGQVWQQEMGPGNFDVSGDGRMRVRASVRYPNPGRTVYTVPWETPAFADVAVTMKPPGSRRGQGENGRGGLVFWQDADNYIIINTWLDDYYEGASVSSFFHLNGFEDLYDAVWTNVGKRIRWGRPYRLRVVYDGLRYLAYVDGEPVLYRALTDVYPTTARLAINRVGIVANWEWGNDTGTTFTDFVALSKEITQ